MRYKLQCPQCRAHLTTDIFAIDVNVLVDIYCIDCKPFTTNQPLRDVGNKILRNTVSAWWWMLVFAVIAAIVAVARCLGAFTSNAHDGSAFYAGVIHDVCVCSITFCWSGGVSVPYSVCVGPLASQIQDRRRSSEQSDSYHQAIALLSFAFTSTPPRLSMLPLCLGVGWTTGGKSEAHPQQSRCFHSLLLAFYHY